MLATSPVTLLTGSDYGNMSSQVNMRVIKGLTEINLTKNVKKELSSMKRGNDL